MTEALYNEIDPFAVEWLRNLVAAGLIAPGCVDGRSIADIDYVSADYAQAHFFAGIGVWSYALRRAGIPDDFPVWTGSCPCQPFSVAGRNKGTSDERHLWPEWLRLIAERRPPILFGEQVASPAGRDWLAVVRADLEALGYEVGAADLSAAGVGAPHARQRLFFGAARLEHADRQRCAELGLQLREREERPGVPETGRRGAAVSVADRSYDHRYKGEFVRVSPGTVGTQATRGFWAEPRWLLGRDGRVRPTEPGTFPLANGTPGHVGRLRAYGNAIVAEVAAAFVASFLEAIAASGEGGDGG